jgi:putative transcriptional regulator
MRNRKLASIRKLYGINQTIVSELLNLGVASFSAKETGKTAFTQKEMITITNYFKEFDSKLTMDDIFFIEEVTETVTNRKGA